MNTIIQQARALLAADAVDPSISKQDTIDRLTALLNSAPVLPVADIDAEFTELMRVLERAQSTDFGCVEIDHEHAAEFWAALDAVKAARGGL